jgi:PAS domain S-box-containing protein
MPSGHDAINVATDAERFHLLVDAVTDYAIYMLDLEGRVVSWNAGAERLKGYQPTEIIGQHYRRFFTPEDQQCNLPAQILKGATEHGRYESEGWRLRKDGTRFWASAILQKVQDQRGRHIGFAKVTRDITERKTTQDALLESERRFRILVQAVTDYAIYMLDPGGIVINWNVGAERMLGYRADEIVGQHISRFYGREDRFAGLPARALATAVKEGRYATEGWRVRKDGTRFWAAVVIDAIHDEDGGFIGFAKITRDVTERRQAHEELLASERQFRLLINGVTDYALYMLDPNGIVISWNAGAERIKGYATSEIIGQHFSRFYTAADRAAGLPTRALHAAATQGQFESEGWRVRKDGSLFWANVVIDPIVADEGQLLGFSKITRDITERRNAQLAMRETQAQLAQMQKMEALGQLTGGVAHDFNNLLMVINGYIPRIKQLLAEDPKGLRAAEAIELAAQRGASLTRQLLSFSRRQSLRPTVVNLAEIAGATRPILTSLIGGSINYVTTILPEIWPVRVDVGELELAIINLVANARDAMGQGGTLSVMAENVRLSRGEITPDLEGEFVALAVADTGHGIPPDILEKVFDPFFTTKGEGKGTGLGLSQVHGFVHQSGGGITINSEMGEGTCITLYLPRATAEVSSEAAAGTQTCSSTGLKVLLVEDNPEVAEVTTELLSRMGCEAETVHDAEAALKALDRGGFDLVLSDIVMGGSMNGVDLARVIRKQHPTLRVVLASGYSDAAATATEEFTVLRKPYQVEDLDWAVALPLRATTSEPANQRNVVDFRDTKRSRPPDGERPKGG